MSANGTILKSKISDCDTNSPNGTRRLTSHRKVNHTLMESCSALSSLAFSHLPWKFKFWKMLCLYLDPNLLLLGSGTTTMLAAASTLPTLFSATQMYSPWSYTSASLERLRSNLELLHAHLYPQMLTSVRNCHPTRPCDQPDMELVLKSKSKTKVGFKPIIVPPGDAWVGRPLSHAGHLISFTRIRFQL